ncbi:MAG: DUF72 domain-containing protein [Gemmataceae bacterium]
MRSEIFIGTAGYSYPDWVGPFYPQGTRPDRMLPFYATRFALVELNFTFHRPPTRTMLVKLADKTPRTFQFVVKLPQTISHEQRPLDLPGFRHAVEGLKERGQLAGLLAQFPPSLHCSRAACDWITTLAKELNHLCLAVEFRHRSWDRPGLPDWLAEQHLTLVAVDVPALSELFPAGWRRSTALAYVRLHTRNAAKWHKGGPERYDYSYSDAELEQWVEALRTAENLSRALVIFNNCVATQAAENAQRFRQRLQRSAASLEVVPPPGIPAPQQNSLFG